MRRLFFLFLILLGVFFTFLKYALPSSSNLDWDIPELPPQYIWKNEQLSETALPNIKTYVDSRYATDGIKITYNEINYKSAVSFYTIVLDTEVNSFIGSKLFKEMDETMRSHGWLQGFRYKNSHIMGMAADGPAGSITGFVKIIDNQIRTIVYQYDMHGTTIEKNGEATGFSCPCETTLKVIVSDPVTLPYSF